MAQGRVIQAYEILFDAEGLGLMSAINREANILPDLIISWPQDYHKTCDNPSAMCRAHLVKGLLRRSGVVCYIETW